MTSRGAAKRRAKRMIDIVVAAAALVLLSPVLAATAVAIRIVDGSPVLFRQVRPGLHGRPFTIVKFRTMRATRHDEDPYRTDALRVSRLGRILRRTSLDELPELWNVIRGEMSLVGPRPLLTEYLARYSPRQARRHEVPPGITSWAIVRGRHSLTFDQRLELDVWYVDHWSLGLDFRVLAATVRQLVRRSDVAETQDVDTVGFPLPPSADDREAPEPATSHEAVKEA